MNVFCVVFVLGHEDIGGLRGFVPLLSAVVPAAIAVATVVVVELVRRILGAPGAIVASVSVEVNLGWLILIPIFVRACL